MIYTESLRQEATDLRRVALHALRALAVAQPHREIPVRDAAAVLGVSLADLFVLRGTSSPVRLADLERLERRVAEGGGADAMDCGARRPGWEAGPEIGRHRQPCVRVAGHRGVHRDALGQSWEVVAHG